MSAITWTSERPARDAHVLGYVAVSIRVDREGDQYVGFCKELDVSNFGATVDEAIHTTLNAVELYLETLDELGTRDKVFKEKGLKFEKTEPTGSKRVNAEFGEVISSQRLAAVG